MGFNRLCSISPLASSSLYISGMRIERPWL
nr:TPA_asm: m69.5 sORF 1 [Murid betaherpesvirus 1]DBA07812.1 TPA_asm: m69.5 sORF 1 [Murid betaherpesvirus 1]